MIRLAASHASQGETTVSGTQTRENPPDSRATACAVISSRGQICDNSALTRIGISFFPPEHARSYGNRKFDKRMVYVVVQGDICKHQVKKRLWGNSEARQGVRLSLQLAGQTLDVIQVDMGVTERMNKDAWLQRALLRDHH